ncbi:sugar ABC transporter substrate-binding protein [Cytobacillus sp. IB215316]|uniref:sugar ABC transporter substrate-binding protein n=1 Tax=Cytobacillus sp. IB215316 TaxID=3097354 RepID=UPI002A0F585C|nr:substrate-binding domain-containing protein [Cytobacillus sp. IB215316]MDX8360961.1 substrate-binding domain-containing protein [Cytobacillus sp. IB215316]
MQKIVVFILSFVSIILFYFTFLSASKVFRTDWQLPETLAKAESDYRLVLITQDLDTPFWVKVGEGALEQAQSEEASLEIWGSYGNNKEDFLKQIELAIYSQVDGIIVQGYDTDDFKNLTKIKAASYGIPIITVANDVPMNESLRRTYVGSDQYLAGQLIAKQLISDMGDKGEVILMFDRQHQYYQDQRLKGIKDVLNSFPHIDAIEAETSLTRESVNATTKDMLNKFPHVDAFIAVNANISETMVLEIESRSQVEPYYIYSFDDDRESLSLLKEGKLDGMIEQSPQEMGKMSVSLITQWLKNEKEQLNLDGYFTDIKVVKAIDVR